MNIDIAPFRTPFGVRLLTLLLLLSMLPGIVFAQTVSIIASDNTRQE